MKRAATKVKPFVVATLLLSFLPFSGLGSCNSGTCDRVAQTGCDTGLVCESIQSGGTGCVHPLLVRGTVEDFKSGAAIAGARVIALDANGSPVSAVGTSDASGAYELTVRDERASDATLMPLDFTLRADAAGYQAFPSKLTQAMPLTATGAAVDQAGEYVISTGAAQLGLVALEAGGGTAAIHGVIEMPQDGAGVLVVAESSPTQGFSAFADVNGSYRIFNLPADTYSVTGYTEGVNCTPVAVVLADGQDAEANLALNSDPTSTLSGSVQIVNAGQAQGTSVILVVESTFDPLLIRGDMPPGLRAPASGTDPNVTGNFSITGVPAGNYVVLAALENDGLVRDPDTCIGGTDLLHQTVGAGETLSLSSGFKITGALEVLAPGAAGPETVSSTTPTFSWRDDSSEDAYRVTVTDSFGNTMWETEIPGVSGGNPSVTYNADGTALPLQHGEYYQFRATSLRKTGGGDPCPISQTEDLKGVFFLPP